MNGGSTIARLRRDRAASRNRRGFELDPPADKGEKTGPEPPAKPRHSAAAERALAEAAARRAKQEAKREADRPREINGRDGPEPTRYGDWEVRGVASDF